MNNDFLTDLYPTSSEDPQTVSSQSPSVASSSPARTSTFSHSSALSDAQMTAMDVLDQPGMVEQGSSISSTLKTGLKHVSAWLPATWTPESAEDFGEAASVPSLKVLKIQQIHKYEYGVILADNQQLQLWDFNADANVPLLRTTVEEKRCVDAVLCGKDMLTLAIICEVTEAPPVHDLKIVDLSTEKILGTQRLTKPAVGLQTMNGFVLVLHAAGSSVYKAESCEFIRHINTVSSVVSTSNRWLAFEGPPAKAPHNTQNEKNAYDVGDTARTVVAGIVGLSKTAHKHLSPILKGQDHNQAPRETRSRSNSEGSKTPNKPPVGWVGIYHVDTDTRSNSSNLSDASSEQYDDTQSRPFELKQLANFHASSESLAAVQFSPSGTKLACAPASGQVILVYNLVKPHDDIVYDTSQWDQSKRLRVGLAFKLVRGYTPSRVLSLQFSTREDRLCAVSSRGTVHVFDMPRPTQPENDDDPSSQHAGAMSVDKLLSSIPGTPIAPDQQALFRIKLPRRQVAQSRTPSSDDNDMAAAMHAAEQRRSSHPGAGPFSPPSAGDVKEQHEHIKIAGAAAFVSPNSLLMGTTQSLLSMYSFSECPQDSPLAVWNSSVEAFYAATGHTTTPQRESVQLVAKEVSRWDLETLIPSAPRSTYQTAPKQTRPAQGGRYNWLQYATDETSQPPLVPLWLRPPVNFYISNSTDQTHTRMHPVFNKPRENQAVTVRRLGPVAMQPSSDEPARGSPPQLTSVLGTSPLYGTVRDVAFPSNMLPDSISKAMDTELRPEKRLVPPVTEDSRLFDGNSLIYTSDNYFRSDAEPQSTTDTWDNTELDELEGIFQFDEQRGSTASHDPPLDLSLLMKSVENHEAVATSEEHVDDTPLPLDPLMEMTLEDINAADNLSYHLSTNASPDSVKDAPAPERTSKKSKAKRR